jgi:hypothetical protein
MTGGQRRCRRSGGASLASICRQASADENGEFTNSAIRRAYGNSQSSRSRIERLIEWGLIENIGRNRYRLID